MGNTITIESSRTSAASPVCDWDLALGRVGDIIMQIPTPRRMMAERTESV